MLVICAGGTIGGCAARRNEAVNPNTPIPRPMAFSLTKPDAPKAIARDTTQRVEASPRPAVTFTPKMPATTPSIAMAMGEANQVSQAQFQTGPAAAPKDPSRAQGLNTSGLDLNPTRIETSESEEGTINVARMTYAEEGSDFDPSPSRDGTMLAYSSTQHRATSDIYVKRVDSRVTTRLTNDPAQDMMPRISPNGDMIAFASDRSGNWDIFVMPITGGKAVQLTQGVEHEIAPSWSPDGTHLVYSRMGSTSGRWEMWVGSLDNPDSANFIGYGLFPQWSPVGSTGTDGRDRILYQLGRERGRKSFGLWTLDYAQGKAGNNTEVASSAEAALINPSWSPSGEWIVYAQVPLDSFSRRQPSVESERNPDVRPHAALYMVSAQGEGQVRLTTGAGSALSPSWTKNDRLYFVSNRDGTDNIWALDLSGALQTAMATVGGTTGMAGTKTNDAVDAMQPSEDVANAPEGQ